MSMRGIDIASYQSGLNLLNIDYDFVLIKATQGANYVNPYADKHFQQAKAAGKKIGVYHYADGGNAVTEANWFVDNCAGYIRQAIFVLDWEGTGVEFTAWALQFLKQVESRIGYKPAIYMSEWVVNHYNWRDVVNNNNGLWVAKYSDYEIDNNYDMTNAGQEPNVQWWPFYFMWQWTSKGRVSGYAGDLDCNIAYLTPAGWDAYAGDKTPLQPPAPEPTTTTTTQAPVPDTTTTTTAPGPGPRAPGPPAPSTTTTTTVAPDPLPVPPETTTTTTRKPAPPTLWAVLVAVLINSWKNRSKK